EDLCRRADLSGLNKRVMESLIKVGTFDSFKISRGTLLSNVDRILSLAQREHRLRETGQSTMFDLWGAATPAPMPSLDLESADVSVTEKLAWEKELTGVYLSEHPFSAFANKIGSETTLCGQIDAEMAGQTVVVAGIVTSIRQMFTRDRHIFVSAVLEDLDGSIEAMVWPRVYAETRDLWQEGSLLLVEGKVRLKDDRVQLTCDRVRRYQPEEPQEEKALSKPAETAEIPPPPVAEPAAVKTQHLLISITQTNDKASDIAYLLRLIDTLKEFPGQDEVSLRVTNGEKIFNLSLSNIKVNYCPELHQRLADFVGKDKLKLDTESA
ncbi:MAG: DNA polymerase III subunit alpha, partial [Chloroflexi bacterium]|nr:DNA polymerase III subunit alpha [Chloroflexota bacterium]